MTPMLRSLALLLTLLLAAPALATDLQSRAESRDESRSFGLSGWGGFGLVADFSRNTETTAAGRHINETSVAGLAWQQGGFKVTTTGGLYGYDLTGAGTGQGRVASFAISHELAVAGGGTLSVELRQSRLWEADASLDVRSARLGWSLKF
jgi:hypothetical protein